MIKKGSYYSELSEKGSYFVVTFAGCSNGKSLLLIFPEKTFMDSALTWDIKKGSPQYYMHLLYKDLIFLRKKNLSGLRPGKMYCDERNQWLAFKYAGGNSRELFVVISFLDRNHSIKTPFGLNRFHELLNTSDTCYGGKLLQNQQKTGNEIWFPGCGAIIGKGL